MQCTNHDCSSKAVTSRPAENHMRGDISAQQFCEPCGAGYDNMIAKRQVEAREYRKKDLEKHKQNQRKEL